MLYRIYVIIILSIISSCSSPIDETQVISTQDIIQENIWDTSWNTTPESHIHPSSWLCIWGNDVWIFRWYKNNHIQAPKDNNSLLCSNWADLIKAGSWYIYQELSWSTVNQYPLGYDQNGHYWLGKTEVYNPQGCIWRIESSVWRLFWAFDWTDTYWPYGGDISTFISHKLSVGCYDTTTENKNLIGSDNYGDKNGTYWWIPISGWPGIRVSTKTGGILSGELLIFPDGSRSSAYPPKNDK